MREIIEVEEVVKSRENEELRKEIQELKKTVTTTQLALTEVAEMVIN